MCIRDRSGTVPFVEAVMRSPIEIVQKLMKKKDCNFDIKDKAGVSPLVGALFFGNQETIEALRKRGVHFPATLEPQEQQMMNHVMERLHRLGDTEAIKQLLQWNNADCADFTNLFREFLKVNNFSLLKECIREKLFSKRAA